MNKKSTAKQNKPATRPYFVPGVGTVKAVDLADLADKLNKKEEVGDANN